MPRVNHALCPLDEPFSLAKELWCVPHPGALALGTQTQSAIAHPPSAPAETMSGSPKTSSGIGAPGGNPGPGSPGVRSVVAPEPSDSNLRTTVFLPVSRDYILKLLMGSMVIHPADVVQWKVKSEPEWQKAVTLATTCLDAAVPLPNLCTACTCTFITFTSSP